MNYNSKRGVQIMDSLHNMLVTISEISKNTQNFGQLEELLPLITDLRKTDLDNKQITQSLKTIGEIVSKLKNKVLPTNRGNDSASQVYDRMINHLNFELNKLNIEVEDITNKEIGIQSCQEEQIKCEATAIIKQIEQVLASSKKIIHSSMNQKRKEYLNQSNPHHYLNRILQQRLKSNTTIRHKLQQSKYEFGQFRNFYNLYQSKHQDSSVQNDIQRLKSGKETGMDEGILKKIQAKIQLEKRKSFMDKCQAHLQKQYHFVLKNLQKFNYLKNPGKYQQNLFHHYYGWGKKLKILLQSILIKLSSFERNKLNIKQQQGLLTFCKDQQSKYQKMLIQLMDQLK